MLAGMDAMKEALDKAASSPDLAVRSMAIDYQETLQKLDRYEAFFDIYKEGIKINGTVVRPAPRGRAPVTAKVAHALALPRSSNSGSSKTDGFSLALQAIMVETGHPMKLDELYSGYQQKHPEDPVTKETFRQRLVKRRDTVILIRGQGYWWNGAELPAEAVAAENV